ncbi:MAG: clostripain-related cysteine peptidase [Vulcanimicrobiota bacterium]
MENINKVTNLAPAGSQKPLRIKTKSVQKAEKPEIQDRIELDAGSSVKGSQEKEITFLFYMNGQYSDLEQPLAAAMLGLENVGSDENVNVVAQLGRAAQKNARPAGGFDRIDNDWSGVRRFHVVKSPNPSQGDKSLQTWLEIKDKLPGNPLVYYTIGDVHSKKGDQAQADKYYEKARDLGYEKFLDEPFNPDVSRWSCEFDRAIQPLRDNEAENNIFASPVVEYKGDANMMHPDNLRDFVSWGMKNYPARHYCLVMMGHGNAWAGSMKMNPSEMAMAIQAGTFQANQETGKNGHMDMMVFNSCYMGNLEALDQMKHASDITVASQMAARTSIFYHWPRIISKVQKAVRQGEEFEPREFARDLVNYYKEIGVKDAKEDPMIRRSRESYLTLAAIDNKKLDPVKKAWGKLVSDWKNMQVEDHKVYESIKKSQNFASYAYSHDTKFDFATLRDLGSIAINILNNPEIPKALKDDCQEIRKSLRDAIIAEQHTGFGMENSTGISVWAPASAGDISMMKKKYRNSVPSFVQETGWADKMEDSMQSVSRESLNAFLRTVEELAHTNKMMEMPGLAQDDYKGLQRKSEFLEQDARQLQKEIDLSRLENYKQSPLPGLPANMPKFKPDVDAEKIPLPDFDEGNLLSHKLNTPAGSKHSIRGND